MLDKQLWKIVFIIACVSIIALTLKNFQHIVEHMTPSNDAFQIQYQVKGIENDPNKDIFMATIKKVMDKVGRIITKSNKLNYVNKDTKLPVQIINDLYITITLSEDNIKEESGAISKDTVGGSNIVETQNVGTNIFPVIGTIQMVKSTSTEDIKVTYDAVKYPHTQGLNRFYYLLLHEVLHVLGVGFLWTQPDYEEGKAPTTYERFWISDPKNNPSYVGPVLAKYNGVSATVYYYSKSIGQLGKLKRVPIEDNGEAGTKLWHWEQGYYNDGSNVVSQNNRVIDGIKTPGLDNEVMVGWGTDKPPYLSQITIANLEDLGYQVNYNEADVLGSSEPTITTSNTSPTQSANTSPTQRTTAPTSTSPLPSASATTQSSQSSRTSTTSTTSTGAELQSSKSSPSPESQLPQQSNTVPNNTSQINTLSAEDEATQPTVEWRMYLIICASITILIFFALLLVFLT